jgi:hypothetical protein
MNFKILTASILAIIAIAAPAIANPNWKVFGKSNSGSEIALDLNSFYHDEGLVYFQYKTTKNGKSTAHMGVSSGCQEEIPQGWSALSTDGSRKIVQVLADSPASKAMSKKVCQVANTKKAAKDTAKSRLTNCQESRATVERLKAPLAGTNSASSNYIRALIDTYGELGCEGH